MQGRTKKTSDSSIDDIESDLEGPGTFDESPVVGKAPLHQLQAFQQLRGSTTPRVSRFGLCPKNFGMPHTPRPACFSVPVCLYFCSAVSPCAPKHAPSDSEDPPSSGPAGSVPTFHAPRRFYAAFDLAPRAIVVIIQLPIACFLWREQGPFRYMAVSGLRSANSRARALECPSAAFGSSKALIRPFGYAWYGRSLSNRFHQPPDVIPPAPR